MTRITHVDYFMVYISARKRTTLHDVAEKYELPVELSGGQNFEKYLKKERLEFNPPIEDPLLVNDAKPQRFLKGNLIKNGNKII